MYAYSELINKFNRSTYSHKFSYKLENNTQVITNNRYQFTITLWENKIADYTDDSTIVLYSSGYKTHTTKDRLNKILHDNSTGYSIYQSHNIWYVSTAWNQIKVKFNEGITFKRDFNTWEVLNYAVDNAAELKALKHKITKYVNSFYQQFITGKLDQPSPGDCFDCSIFHSTDKTHLISHIDENYYVPSLLVNAFNKYPNSPMGSSLMYAWANKTDEFSWLVKVVGYQIKKSLYRYMIDQLITNT